MLINSNDYSEFLKLCYSKYIERLDYIKTLKLKERISEVQKDCGFVPAWVIKNFFNK